MRRGRKFPFFGGVSPGAIGGGLPQPPPTLTYRGHAETGVDGTSFTSGSIPIGDESASRYVIVCVYGASTAIASVSCSAGGTFSQIMTTDSNRVKAFIGLVPTGTNATFTLNSGGSQARQGLAVYTAENLASTVVRDSAVWTAAAGEVLDVDVLEGGFVIGYGYGNQNPEFVWTGLSEDHETLMESGVDHSSASASGLSAAAPRAVSVAITAGASNSSRGFAIAMR